VIAALVALEIALVCASVWLMHRHLLQAIEDSLYRVHLSGTPPLLDLMLRDALPLLGTFVIVNLLAVFAVEFAWRRSVRPLLGDFMALMTKTRSIDFSPDPEFRPRHALLELAIRYRESERARLQAILAGIARLDEAARASEFPQARRALEDLRSNLR
jgi:hypothetical protein